MIMRNFIFRNGTAYDINLTIASLLGLREHHSVQECVNALVEFQFRGSSPEFLPDVQDTSRDVLVVFDYWLQLFGVEVEPDATISLDDGSNSLSVDDLDDLSAEPVITSEEEERISSAATIFRRMLREQNASPDTVMNFPGIEYTFHFDLDNEEHMEEE